MPEQDSKSKEGVNILRKKRRGGRGSIPRSNIVEAIEFLMHIEYAVIKKDIVPYLYWKIENPPAMQHVPSVLRQAYYMKGNRVRKQ